MEYLQWFLFLVSYLVLLFLTKIMVFLWWRPRNIVKHFGKQGIRGPKYHFYHGNNKELTTLISEASSQPMSHLSHNIVPRVLSFYHHYKKIYGATFLLWFGPTARLTISDPILIKEIFTSKSEFFEKYDANPQVRNLEGDSLQNLEGEKWVHHRRIIAPTFHMENLKLMIPIIGKSVAGMLEKWSKMSNSGKVEIEISNWFQTVTEEIITRTLFGSRSEDGKSIFQLQAQQMIYAMKSFQEVFILGSRFLPTEKNRISRTLNKKIRASLMKLIQRHRVNSNSCNGMPSSYPKDLLDQLITASKKETKESGSKPNSSSAFPITVDDIVEECKGLFFAGKHTTTNLMTWTIILLAMHPTWQELAREEVLSVCGARDIPAGDDVAKLKMVYMILCESLRLYPPVVATIRRVKTDVDLRGYKIPCGTELLIPVVAVHHDPTLWGHDASDFNPARFSQGVAHAAKHPMAFIPFSLGPRSCIGQNLAIMQAKVTIAMILQRFSFDLAPTYQHAPTVLMHLYPKHGAPIIFRNLPGNDNDFDQSKEVLIHSQ